MQFHPPTEFTPNFAKGNGLVAVIAQDAASGEILMLAWMNAEAWAATLTTGQAHYFSRSRNSLWHKGATSGHVQHVQAIRLDCDSDALVLRVIQEGGAACHEGYASCFYRELIGDAVQQCSPLVFNPKEIYS